MCLPLPSGKDGSTPRGRIRPSPHYISVESLISVTSGLRRVDGDHRVGFARSEAHGDPSAYQIVLRLLSMGRLKRKAQDGRDAMRRRLSLDHHVLGHPPSSTTRSMSSSMTSGI